MTPRVACARIGIGHIFEFMTGRIRLQGASFEIDPIERVLYVKFSDSAPDSHPNPAVFTSTFSGTVEISYDNATFFESIAGESIEGEDALQLNNKSASTGV